MKMLTLALLASVVIARGLIKIVTTLLFEKTDFDTFYHLQDETQLTASEDERNLHKSLFNPDKYNPRVIQGQD